MLYDYVVRQGRLSMLHDYVGDEVGFQCYTPNYVEDEVG